MSKIKALIVIIMISLSTTANAGVCDLPVAVERIAKASGIAGAIGAAWGTAAVMSMKINAAGTSAMAGAGSSAMTRYVGMAAFTTFRTATRKIATHTAIISASATAAFNGVSYIMQCNR